MGTDCAPLLANLFLFFYEYKCKLSTNHKEAILFKHTVRYIDDLLTLFLKLKYLIYTPLS